MEKNYEDSVKELEQIIRELDSKDLTLEESINKYERGIELYKYCSNVLKEYEGRVKNIIDENSDILKENENDRY
ncbi:exodeoxyribonuclease VII small subunit [Peptoniphilus sp.]|jgi:exodeoxyribonuclease VII small subunit|uniref:exodeoxyribonuclease VII small subunit n=1 Tax=Peptoniphilus sp. TaxID=1971214 RepID=UPI003D905EEA